MLSGLCRLISGGLSIDEGGGFKIFATWARAHQLMALHMQSHLNCPRAAQLNGRVQHRLSGVASLIDDLDGSGKNIISTF